MTEWELFATCFSIAFCPKSMSQYSTKLAWHAITRSAVQSASFFADMAHQSLHKTGRAICENMPMASYLAQKIKIPPSHDWASLANYFEPKVGIICHEHKYKLQYVGGMHSGQTVCVCIAIIIAVVMYLLNL